MEGFLIVLAVVIYAAMAFASYESIKYFKQNYNYGLWPGIILEAIAVGALFLCFGMNKGYPDDMVLIAVVSTIISLIMNIKACGIGPGLLALLPQLILGAGIILAIILILIILSNDKNKKNSSATWECFFCGERVNNSGNAPSPRPKCAKNIINGKHDWRRVN